MVASYSSPTIQAGETRTLVDVAGLETIPTLVDLAKAYGTNTYATTLLMNHLVSLLDFVDSKLVKAQYTHLCILLATEYYYLNLVEWVLFFRKCKLGEYGQMIWGDKLNTQTLMIGLRKFLTDRIDAISIRERKQKSKSEIIQVQAMNLFTGLGQLKALKEKAKTDYKAFRELFPKLPNDRSCQVYWRGWRLYESVGKMLCEFNIENKLIKKNHE